ADPRTDLWAVGAILHEMLAGKPPFGSLDADAILDELMKLDEPVPAIGAEVADLPVALERAVQRCLAKRKAERFGSANELLRDVEALLPQCHGRQLAEDESPFPGLSSFQEADANRFFGRTHEVAEAVARLQRHPVLGIVGPSGSGKSSFVR